MEKWDLTVPFLLNFGSVEALENGFLTLSDLNKIHRNLRFFYKAEIINLENNFNTRTLSLMTDAYLMKI